MAKVIITEALVNRIKKVFSRAEANAVMDLLETLEHNPHKGKALSHVVEFVIKEIKYKKYRFYFITDGHVLKFGTEEELSNLIIKFVRMSEKKDQQKIIGQLKDTLRAFGLER